MIYYFRNVYFEIVIAISNNSDCSNAFLDISPKILVGMFSCLSRFSYFPTALVTTYDYVLSESILD